MPNKTKEKSLISLKIRSKSSNLPQQKMPLSNKLLLPLKAQQLQLEMGSLLRIPMVMMTRRKDMMMMIPRKGRIRKP